MPACVQYPTVGCVVEFFDSSTLQAGMVTEEVSGRLRLLLPNRRETKLPSARVLPWIAAPCQGFASMTREDMVKLLEETRRRREELARSVDPHELWELAQGEVDRAGAAWFAELVESSPDADFVAACGHALLGARTLFRFVPPEFEVYDAETVARKEEEKKKQEERERIVAEGAPFVHLLAAVMGRRAELPPEDRWPSADVCARIEETLRALVVDPDASSSLWAALSKGLGDDPMLPVRLLMAWGKLEPHHNFWLDKADYVPGDTWWHKHEEAARALAENPHVAALPLEDLPFVSVDGDSTRDMDDAFHIERVEGDVLRLSLALACPALDWPFGSKFDTAVRMRGTSLYLPEGDCHMLPEFLGVGALSLFAGEERPALVIRQDMAADGTAQGPCTMLLARVRLAANLRYRDCQAVLDGTAPADSPARAHEEQLKMGLEFARRRLARRVADGAVVLSKGEPSIHLSGSGEDVKVNVVPGDPASDSQNMVAEMMIFASAVAADWAVANSVPMLFRSQEVTLPREYAGVWEDPVRMGEIMRSLVPSILETHPHLHAALGVPRYAPVTSPLRRYADLVNEAQILSFLADGRPRFDQKELEELLLYLHMGLDPAVQVQRNRPRYWKLLYFAQQGEDRWWNGVVTEENETQFGVTLPGYDIFLRGKKRLFDERTTVGSRVRIRLGKVSPLYNEMQILEAETDGGYTDGADDFASAFTEEAP